MKTETKKEARRAKLTKRVVDAAQKEAKRYTIWDTEIMGFGLQVMPSGVRSYIYNYRTPEGRDRRISIGKTSDWAPDQARAKADDYREDVKHDRDPLAAKQARREALTVTELLDLYLESAAFTDKAATSQVTDRGRVERHLKVLLGKRYADQITTDDVRRAHRDIETGKTAGVFKVPGKPRALARVTGGPTTARDTIGLLRAIYNWAIPEGLIASNPAASIKLPASRKRELIVEDIDAYGVLFKAIEDLQAEKELTEKQADAIKVLAMVGARKNEIAAVRIGEVDRQGSRIVLRHHKTAKTSGQDRIINLPAAALEIIEKHIDAQPGAEPTDYVFQPVRGDGGPMSLKKPWARVRAKAKLPEKLGLHGLRHSAGSHLAMNGAEAAQIMVALGHKQLSTAQRYIHFAKNARAKLADEIAATALAGLALAQAKPADNDEEAA